VTSPWTTELVQSLEYQRGLQVEHKTILDAIIAGDAEAARAAMRLHLARSQSRYQLRLHERAAHFSASVKDEA
jgi:DNA-binding FadR family transcriptional regulator